MNDPQGVPFGATLSRLAPVATASNERQTFICKAANLWQTWSSSAMKSPSDTEH